MNARIQKSWRWMQLLSNGTMCVPRGNMYTRQRLADEYHSVSQAESALVKFEGGVSDNDEPFDASNVEYVLVEICTVVKHEQ